MAIEIERKFLLKDDDWRDQAHDKIVMRQGYMASSLQATVRVRLSGNSAYLTIKGATEGLRRHEYEYEIPVDDAQAMLDGLCEKPLIEKTRYLVNHGAHLWEIDVFSGDNEGLSVAEVELASENEALDLPPWIGREVSDDTRYFNACLARHPYREWKR